MGMPYSDPFGAPQYFCEDMILEDIAPGIVAVRMLCRDGGDMILRCTLIMAAAAVTANMARTAAFLMGDGIPN